MHIHSQTPLRLFRSAGWYRLQLHLLRFEHQRSPQRSLTSALGVSSSAPQVVRYCLEALKSRFTNLMRAEPLGELINTKLLKIMTSVSLVSSLLWRANIFFRPSPPFFLFFTWSSLRGGRGEEDLFRFVSKPAKTRLQEPRLSSQKLYLEFYVSSSERFSLWPSKRTSPEGEGLAEENWQVTRLVTVLKASAIHPVERSLRLAV